MLCEEMPVAYLPQKGTIVSVGLHVTYPFFFGLITFLKGNCL